MRKPSLPPGSVISYCDINAIVVEDRGDVLTVIVGQMQQVWKWKYDYTKCVVVSVASERLSRPCWMLTNGKEILAASWNRARLKATKPCHEILQADVVGRSKNKGKT